MGGIMKSVLSKNIKKAQILSKNRYRRGFDVDNLIIIWLLGERVIGTYRLHFPTIF
jgi:hypothetical protein